MNLKPVLSTNFLSVILVIFVLSIFSISVTASDDQAKTGKDFNPGDMITKHIADAHEWHFATIGKFHISIPLPIIIFSKGKGLDVFMFTKVKHPGDEFRGYSSSHEGKIIHADESEAMIWNFSITKVVVSMLISIFLMLWIFISVARTYKRREGQAPKGLQSLIEPLILFIKDDVAVPMLGDKHVKYLPYLLTVFFFIWINNLMGLIPGGANVTGNIAVTLTLAAITFVIFNFSSNKHYWKHMFAMPGVPGWLKYSLMPIVEVMSWLIKPVALIVRLFANITAGHMIILALISLIFIFGEMSIGHGIGASVISMAFTIFAFFIELLVAVLQAYIFTILSALFISEAIAKPHAEHE